MGKNRTLPAALSALSLAACSGSSDGPGPIGVEPPGPNLECTIPADQVFSGGVGRDQIPALTNPEVDLARTTPFFNDHTRVLGVVVNGSARAYPFDVMWWHEVVNDTLGGEPVLISYCPLTGSGIAFDPQVGGDARNFGVSGLLFENNLIMFDRTTNSFWNQLLLGSVCGVDRGTELIRIPIVETTLGYWESLYPNTTVVTTNTGFDRNYGVYPYDDYADPDNDFLFLPSSPFSTARPPKEVVFGMFANGEQMAFPYGVLGDLGSFVAINERVGGRPILVTYFTADETAVGYAREVGGQELTFSVLDANEQTLVDAETSSTWNKFGIAIDGPLSGERLVQLEDAFAVFWFAWSATYPNTRILN